MEFRKILENDVREKLNSNGFRILKIAFIKRSGKLKIFYINDSGDCKHIEETIVSFCNKSLGNGVELEFSKIISDASMNKDEVTLKKLFTKVYHKDPLAKIFFNQAKVTFLNENRRIVVSHYNEALVNNLVGKNSHTFLGEILCVIFKEEITVDIEFDPNLSMEEVVEDNSNERLSFDVIKIGERAKKEAKNNVDDSLNDENLKSMEKSMGNEPISNALELSEKEKEEIKKISQNLNKKTTKSVKNEGPTKQYRTKIEDPGDGSVLYGRGAIKGNSITIDEIDEAIPDVFIEGEVFKSETRELKTGKILQTFFISDETSSISCKVFVNNKEEVLDFKSSPYVKVKGNITFDAFSKELTMMVRQVQKAEKKERMDESSEKRVELHAHTFMSQMDSVISVKTLIKTAKKWGHKAIAITDHAVVQAYPDAQNAAKENDIKVIYGVEANIADDITPMYNGENNITFKDSFVIFDIETTGFSSVNDKIIEIGAVKIQDKKVVGRFSEFVDPKVPLPEKIVELTKITDSMVRGQKTIEEVLPSFLEFSKGSCMVAHNANFDMGFIRHNAKMMGLTFDNPQIDTVMLARYLFPELKRHRLNDLAKHLSIFMGSHHRAVDDAQTTVSILENCFEMLEKNNIFDTDQLNKDYKDNIDIKKISTYHAIILTKNQMGLKSLYEMITKSNLDYYFRVPRIPKSLLIENRENLLIGSACSNSELFVSMLESRSDEAIDKIADFYDYYEIQPLGNNMYLTGPDGRATKEQLMDMNRRIIEISKEKGKLTCATGDVHMLKKSDEIFRRILLNFKGFDRNSTGETPLPFLTTNEMLDEFSYLGRDLAREVVIENTNKIADLIEDVKPVPDGTFPPKWEGAEEEVTNMVMNRAHEIYGDELPEIVQKRVDRELNSIISNGYAVLYLVAHKLVKKSLDDNYLVGSRGSVGSSLVATFMDITEVNGLVAHYVCPKCKHSEFFDDGTGKSGVDLPDKNCPICGTPYKKDGHDIPFETFLGFEGDKEPDIDLNFSGEYQPEVHKYCEVLFGKGFVFRAGTIGTVADKTALGYVKRYFEDRNQTVSRAEMERLAMGCTGVKRTTGQHPGGIMVVPADNDIHNFCPVQKPADDQTTDTITTHFDYHSISGRLLKLDILGHDDPTMLKMLQDLTGLNPREIPLNDPKVISLFEKPDALGVTSEELGTPVGTYGIPEFGTKFVMQMLVDTKPKSFADLVRISGLSHGTDVWLNNAQYYIKNGDTDLEGCISLRDNIMIYLIAKGIEKKTSFFITEKVRKGKGLSEEYEKTMREHNVPEWYIESCKKIKYMFPKGHAVAYVTMASRIAYYKVYYPLAYYATFFTVRAKDFDAELVVKGVDAVKARMDELNSQGNSISVKDGNLLSVLELVYEMMMRGFTFENVDLYKSKASEFVVLEKSLLLPFNSVVGVGDNAAKAIEEEAVKGEFYSKEDFRQRTKVTKTVIEALDKIGCFKDLGETNQISFF